MTSTQTVRLVFLILFFSLFFSLFYFFFYPIPFNPSSVNNLTSKSQSTIKQLQSSSEAYPEFAVAVKTGLEVVAERCAIQTNTFLRDVRNVILIAESSEVSLGDIPVYDVYTGTLNNPPKSRRSPEFETISHTKNTTHQLKRRDKDGVVVNQESIGWKLDAHKNLPGMRLLYEKFPLAEWYIMIDDDTYMFFDNLRDRIKSLKLDPSKPHYLGLSSVFTGCDGIQHFGDGPNFAHGGSGIVVSSGAMKKMLKIVESCIDRYRDCWAGDIRLALCLRDAGVLITPQVDFNGAPPNMKFPFLEQNPCTRPITFHHLLPQQIQLLYETEKKMNGFVTYSDVMDRYKHLNHNAANKLVRLGGDYEEVNTTHMDECRSRCERDSRCISWSFANGLCNLKDTHPGNTDVEDVEAFSNVYPMRYTCTKRRK
ncbi:hypothetical protein K7432_012545 [Basidiobolus ranarum]|uniref:Apple domain-containing protein n=1 Tax=Basidiobolus ranarum TaxID=34480 RepID=A0ABR2WKR7_9FUNG